jgi:hypothetical protein
MNIAGPCMSSLTILQFYSVMFVLENWKMAILWPHKILLNPFTFRCEIGIITTTVLYDFFFCILVYCTVVNKTLQNY